MSTRFAMHSAFKFAVTLVALLPFVFACSEKGSWNETEKALIDGADSTMRVLTVESEEDLAVLRGKCADFTDEDLQSKRYSRLAELMLATLKASGNGVGLAGPQVGINRNIVAVQRFDKEGEPVEVYPNISITTARGKMKESNEGCLSIPNKRGKIMRFQGIDISYRLACGRDTVETVKDFTAVIFQHECDHLLGRLYTDRAKEIIAEPNE